MQRFLQLISLFIIMLSYQNCSDFDSLTVDGNSNRPDILDSPANAENTANENDQRQPETNNPAVIKEELRFLAVEKISSTQDSVRLTWTLNDYVKSYIKYGETNALSSQNMGEDSFTFKTHRQTLNGLKADTKYYYAVVAENKDGDILQSETKYFTTNEMEMVDTPPSSMPPSREPTQALTDNREIGQASGVATCGNNVREPTEQCDDGNKNDGDSCSSTCSITQETRQNAYYVATNGSDANIGTNAQQPFKSLNFAAKKLKPGDTLYVKAGDYGNQSLRVSQSGTKDLPIIVEGYKNKPGDNPRYLNFNNESRHNPAVMPLLDGQNRKNTNTAIRVDGSYVHIKNFQITNFHGGAGLFGKFGVLDNIIVTENGDLDDDYSGSGFWLYGSNNTLRNSITIDAGGQSATLYGSHHLAEFNKIYGGGNGDKNGTDYYFIVSGNPSRNVFANNNIVKNNYMERIGQPFHGGHGFTVKKQGENNLFTNNTAVNMTNGSFVARHSGVMNNTYRNNSVIRGSGVSANNGAKNNLFEDITIKDAYFGITFFTGTEDKANIKLAQPIAAESNVFRNIKMERIRYAVFGFNDYANDYKGLARNNVMENITVIDPIAPLFRVGLKSTGNVLKNSKLINVKKYAQERAGFKASELGLTFENVSCENCSFALPD